MSRSPNSEPSEELPDQVLNTGTPDAAETSEPDMAASPDSDDQLAAEDQEAIHVKRHEQLLRALADLDNMRKRYNAQLQHARETERARVAAAFLPLVDNLELALGHADSDPSAIVQGVRAVRDQAVETLARLGYPRHDETGVPFDPGKHEVVSVVDDPEVEPGTVVRVLRPGYGEGRGQLRPQAVVVSQGGG